MFIFCQEIYEFLEEHLALSWQQCIMWCALYGTYTENRKVIYCRCLSRNR